MPRWTEEARKTLSEANKTRKPWLNSTGPRTEEGKARSRLNAHKHGMDSAVMRDIKRLMKEIS